MSRKLYEKAQKFIDSFASCDPTSWYVYSSTESQISGDEPTSDPEQWVLVRHIGVTNWKGESKEFWLRFVISTPKTANEICNVFLAPADYSNAVRNEFLELKKFTGSDLCFYMELIEATLHLNELLMEQRVKFIYNLNPREVDGQIQSILDDFNLTLSVLSLLLGVSESTLYKWHTLRQCPPAIARSALMMFRLIYESRQSDSAIRKAFIEKIKNRDYNY